MQESVDPILKFDEGTIVGEVTNLTADVVSDRVLLGHDFPRIHLDLLHAEADLLLFLLDLEYHHVDFLARIDHLLGVRNSTGPGHLGNVYQSLDAFFQFDERTVGENVDHLAADLCTDREAFLDVVPGTGLGLLQAERDSFPLLVDFEHLHIDLLLDGEDLVGVIDPAP